MISNSDERTQTPPVGEIAELDFPSDQGSATKEIPSQGSSEPRELSANEVQRIIATAARTQQDWGSPYDSEVRSGPPPRLDEILQSEILPTLKISEAGIERLIQAARRAEADRQQQQRTQQTKDFDRMVGPRFATAMLDNYVATTPEQRRVLAAVTTYTNNIRDRIEGGEGIVLFGSAGTGKTHLLVAVARTAIAKGFTVQWRNGSDLFAYFREAIESQTPEREAIRPLVTPELLVVDDVLPPGGTLTDYQASTMYRIVDARYRACKPTLATMNVSDGAEAEKGMGAQVVDRLRHGALCLYCNWTSYRKAQQT